MVIAGARFQGLDKEGIGLGVATLRDRNLLTSSVRVLANSTIRWRKDFYFY